MNNMELHFSANLLNESLARNAVITFISYCNPTLEDISEIKTIVSEAVSNAIIHGYRLDSKKEIILKAEVDDDVLTLEICDFGVGIENIEQAKVPSFTTRPDLERAGMGLTIIESLSGEFKIRSVLGIGTKVFVKKILHKVDICDESEARQ